MEELNFIELLNFYKKKILIIILTTILFLLLGYTYIEYIQVPLYNGTTTIILVEKSDKDSEVTQSEITMNEKLVSTYSEIIKSRRVLKQVIESLDLKISVKALVNQITVTPVSNTSIIKITISNVDNKKAAEIANKIAEVFKKEITQIYNLENVSIIDEALIEETPYNVDVTKQMIVYALIGIIISCGIIFIMYYFNNTIKSKKEIEEKICLPVLGEIPNSTDLIQKIPRKKELKNIPLESTKKEKKNTVKESEEKNKLQKETVKISPSKTSNNIKKSSSKKTSNKKGGKK